MKKSFITGLMILLPIALTIILISIILDFFTSPFLETVMNYLKKWNNLPFLKSEDILRFIAKIIIVILFILTVLLLGFLGRRLFFKTFLKIINKIFLKIPLFKSIYHTAKDLFESILSIDERKAFKYPVLIKFTSEKSSSIGFISGTVPPNCQEKVSEQLSSVFVPTAPHPISGYMIFSPKSEITDIYMTNEEAIKFTVSCGVITPEKLK